MQGIPLRTAIAIALLSAMPVDGALADAIHHAPGKASAVDFINIFEKLSGAHPGVRKGHARGICARGVFTPSETAKQRFESPLFAGSSELVLRFSMAGGNPEADERASLPRGIGVKFLLDDAAPHQIAGLTTPMFAGRTPEQFLGLLRVNHLIRDGKATPHDRERYLANNPEAARQGAWLASHAPAAGYTTARYFGVHSFIADAVGGGTTTFRWELAPVSGERLLTDEERSSLPASFLASRLQRRLKEEGHVAMNWQWTLATDTDAVNDPSLPWPDDRVTLNVGTISITGAGGAACDPVNFDPNRLTAGISPSADPVLALRSAAYAISQGKRLAGQ